MLYVTAYDISSDALRERMAGVLLDYGSRIQESVFECSLAEAELAEMLERLRTVPLAATDKVRIYKLCRKCVEDIRIYGPGQVTRDPDYYIV